MAENMKMTSSRMLRRVVSYKVTNVSEVIITSIIRVKAFHCFRKGVNYTGANFFSTLRSKNYTLNAN
jgi:hypothetical protein